MIDGRRCQDMITCTSAHKQNCLQLRSGPNAVIVRKEGRRGVVIALFVARMDWLIAKKVMVTRVADTVKQQSL